VHRHTAHISRRRKRFGQIFLRDPAVVEQLLVSANLTLEDTVLEIGPGRGALTNALVHQAGALYAIEIEAQYVNDLCQRFATCPQVHIIQADARKYDYGKIPRPFIVVANLPYSVGMVILRRLFVFRAHILRLIVMLQREVAARILATPGSSTYGATTVFFQYYASVQHAFEVSRYAFTPVPAVDSTVLTLAPFPALPWPSDNEQFLFCVVQSAFAHRRKTLRANLLTAPHWSLTRAQLGEVFATLHLGETVRAQELHVSQFVQLAAQLHAFVPGSHCTARSQRQELA
jgi:16S rRNA (adenine1518-N6/adenine1519-N6)-dimethyltransferase